MSSFSVKISEEAVSDFAELIGLIERNLDFFFADLAGVLVLYRLYLEALPVFFQS